MTTKTAKETFEIRIPAGGIELPGTLAIPDGATSIILFAHGSGSSRHSPRNTRVAQRLESGGFATLLFDLLTPAEADDRANVFDIGLLADRLLAATRWVAGHETTYDMKIGYFGASTGAAAALLAATAAHGRVAAIVSRGGRPDLAESALDAVRAPTLLIVGGEDREVLGLNRAAYDRMHCERSLMVVPGAGHLFEEPGAMDDVIRLASEWFEFYLLGREFPGEER